MTHLLGLCPQLTLGGWRVVRGVTIHEYGLLRSLQVPFQLLIFYSVSDRRMSQDWTCVESYWQRKSDLLGVSLCPPQILHRRSWDQMLGLCFERRAANRLSHRTALWDVIMCSLGYWSQLFTEICCICHQGKSRSSLKNKGTDWEKGGMRREPWINQMEIMPLKVPSIRLHAKDDEKWCLGWRKMWKDSFNKITEPSVLFQDFIIKYRKLVKDIDNVRCSSVNGDENSLAQVSVTVNWLICGFHLITRESTECYGYIMWSLNATNNKS